MKIVALGDYDVKEEDVGFARAVLECCYVKSGGGDMKEVTRRGQLAEDSVRFFAGPWSSGPPQRETASWQAGRQASWQAA
jgi:hypothetical protein